MENQSPITDQEIAALTSLDVEKRPADFDRLCEFTLRLLLNRDGLDRHKVFSLLPEADFKDELRGAIKRRSERDWKLAAYCYAHIRLAVLPRSVRRRNS
jgi:hypothetical protein